MPNKEATIVYTYKVTSEAVQKGKAIINTIENITGNPTVVPKEHELPKVEAPLAQYIVVEQTIEMETMIKNSINYFVDEMSYEEYNSIEPRPEYQGIDYPDRPYEEEYDDHAEYEKAYAEYEKAYAEYRRQRDEYYELDDEWWDRYYEWYETSEYGIFMQSFENDDNFKNESIDNLLPIFVSKWGQWNGRDILWKDVFTTQFEILILGFDENNEKVFEESKIIDYSPDICEWKEQKVTFNVYLPENVTKVSVTDDCILKSWIGEIYDNYEYDETLYNRTRMYSIPAECYIYYVDRDAKYVKIPTDEDEWGRLRYWRDFVSGDVYRLEGRWEAMYEGC